ncbi:MAG TPA: bifunctional DNA-formamidopyrimidine glycosylase/DNA-(apurinic or apyrimidinic site) lyase [Egibacteraceae bacterium]|nr:bifunctional DNA-formamidopyrimidine glycosylase/DNA-(apurinic or apyrimidinic site) lyase [Egibacteraceae bacterium]
MTQLPEVEVLRKDLEKELVGKRFKDATVKNAQLVSRHRNRPDFTKALVGRKIDAIQRRGTWLVLELDEGMAMAMHLGDQGSLTRETASEPPGKHTGAVLTFTTGGALHVHDPSKEAELYAATREEVDEMPELQLKGIDPLAQTFTWHALAQELKTRDKPLKALLVDESFIVGLGDLYSDEILWTAGLSGTRKSATLSSQEVRRLYRAVLEVLYEAVKQGGTAEGGDADQTDLFGEEGGFGEYLRVYDREGLPCGRCRQPIVLGKIGKLESFYCANCQT